MEFVPAAAMVALILKIIDFLRYARAGDINGVLTQLSVWFAGVVSLVLVAQTNWADGIEIGDVALSRLGFWSLFFAGLTLASTASVVKDIGYKALDNSNTAKIPTLLPHAARHTTDANPHRPQDVG